MSFQTPNTLLRPNSFANRTENNHIKFSKSDHHTGVEFNQINSDELFPVTFFTAASAYLVKSINGMSLSQNLLRSFSIGLYGEHVPPSAHLQLPKVRRKGQQTCVQCRQEVYAFRSLNATGNNIDDTNPKWLHLNPQSLCLNIQRRLARIIGDLRRDPQPPCARRGKDNFSLRRDDWVGEDVDHLNDGTEVDRHRVRGVLVVSVDSHGWVTHSGVVVEDVETAGY